MRAFTSFLLILVAIVSAFGWHLDPAGEPYDLDEVVSPIVKVVNVVSDKARDVVLYLFPKDNAINESDPLWELYRPFHGKHGTEQVNYVELYLFSVSIKTDGSYHDCYVLYCDEQRYGHGSLDNFVVVQDNDKTSSANLEGWFFIKDSGFLHDASDIVSLPIRSYRGFEQTEKTLADLVGEYWTPEGMVNVE